jgi:predicted metal-dependent phosphoesterase TrpH
MASEPWSVDLHSHTLFSDGTLTPAELVRLARSNGVRALAVTDHDHTGGLDEALEVGRVTGLEIIPGIELSISHAEFEDIHMLVYYFDWHNPHFEARLEEFRVARDTRAERILERINARLTDEGRRPIPFEAVKAQVQGAFGRPHIATALLQHGYVPDMNAAFKEYLIPCNVPKYYMPAAEALALARQCQGISSLAHPRYITSARSRLRQVLGELRACGLDAIEAYHSDHHPEDRLYFIQLANQLGMIVTGGSDYHGFKGQDGQQDSGGKLGSLQLPYGMAVRLRRAHLSSYPLVLFLLHWPPAAAASMRRALETHYQLTHRGGPDGLGGALATASTGSSAGSVVVDLSTAADRQLGTLFNEARRQGWRAVGVPWDTTPPETCEGLALTSRISSERFQHVATERLAHVIVHEAMLA